MYRRCSVLVASAILAIVASRVRAQNNPLQPLSTWDVMEADSGGRSVWVKNNSKSPITIEGVVITRCENIRQNCGEHPANVVVPPGKSMLVFRVEVLSRRLGWSFGYVIKTKHEPLPSQAAPQPTMMGPNGPMGVLLSISVDSFVAAVPAFVTNASCGTIRIPDLPEGHQALIMIFGTPERPVARRVMIRVDANGSAYDYLDARRDPVTDSATTSIQLDLMRQTGMLQNIEGGQARLYRVTGGKLASAESLGRPDSMIARVLRECGRKP